jgi:YqaJ-like viral recombinase domain
VIIHDVKQGTTEWLELRAGIPTASAFDQIITKTGKESASAERYMYTLLAERMMGHPIVDHVSMWMARGSEMERQAIDFYTFTRELETEPVGFITDDDHLYGASPDRLVAEDGLLEVKAPKEWLHVGFMLNSGKAFAEYFVQAQGQLWITGRRWVDLLSYSPELPMSLTRINRDEAFIALLAEKVRNFTIDLETKAEELQKRQLMRAPEKPRLKTASDLMREVLIEANQARR